MAKQIGNTDLIDTWASEGNIVDPDPSKKEEGWLLGEQPPHEWMNHIQNEHGQKINRILADTYSDGVSLRDELDGNVSDGKGARLVRGAVIYVDTKAQLDGLDTSGLADGQQASVGEAGMFVWSGSEWLPKNSETITVRIPSDYSTLQEAIDELSNFRMPQGAEIKLVIESGHEIDSGFDISNGDFSHFNITSEDEVVKVGTNVTPDQRIFTCQNASTPVFDVLIDGDGRIDRVYNFFSCVARLNSGGAKNCLGRPINANNCLVRCRSGVVWDGSDGSVYFTSCVAHVSGNIFKNSSASPVLAASRGSSVEAQDIEVENCFAGPEARRAGSSINLQRSSINGTTSYGARARDGGIISVEDVVMEDVGGKALECFGNGIINGASSFKATASSGNSENGINVFNGGQVSVSSAELEGFGNDGVRAWGGCRVTLPSAKITNSGERGVHFRDLSFGDLVGATITGSGTFDIVVRDGSQINTRDVETSSGGNNIDDYNIDSFNSLDGSNGIAWS